ncbi:Hydrogenase isoenzymes nickel incorporation protein HypB [bacterium HR28]|jgi:hydrogenase nickel incorporation protein HypB|uniref:Hydrogenase accessory protein HypB n=1 Tax=Thermomicrobium roseum TaxID=500 RepID=A0A7C1K588_THERO|nr:Hydrogenase isoenzymes nickel incorporation protein HypB [bacterium HR28]
MAKELVVLEQRLLERNDTRAAELRRRFKEAGVLVVNLMSSPGAGKTTLLTATLPALSPEPAAVVVGDLATDNDARRLCTATPWVRQITTGTVCHLEAAMVEEAIARWDLTQLRYLFIENVGNLVCPASFDLGEAARVVLFAVTEGEDKPEKYPPILHRADLVLLTKSDLLAPLGFDVQRFVASVHRVNPKVPILPVSARTGEGLAAWLDWLRVLRGAWLSGSDERVRARLQLPERVNHEDQRS